MDESRPGLVDGFFSSYICTKLQLWQGTNLGNFLV